MTPKIEAGWLVVPCDASDHAKVHLAVGKTEPSAECPSSVYGPRCLKCRRTCEQHDRDQRDTALVEGSGNGANDGHQCDDRSHEGSA